MKEGRLYLLVAVLVLAGSAQSLGQGKLRPDQIEKVHSHLFQKGPAGEIPNTLSKTSGDVHVACVVGVSQQVKVEMSFTEELALLASDSDLVVLGKAEAGTTHVNAEKDFLYTDWKFTIEEVLKDNPNAPVHPGARILVARPGGKLQINGRMVFANCPDFLDFESGHQYVLYLRFVPETGGYAIRSGAWAFATSPSPERLDPVNFHESKASDKDTLLKNARDGVAISKSSGR